MFSLLQVLLDQTIIYHCFSCCFSTAPRSFLTASKRKQWDMKSSPLHDKRVANCMGLGAGDSLVRDFFFFFQTLNNIHRPTCPLPHPQRSRLQQFYYCCLLLCVICSFATARDEGRIVVYNKSSSMYVKSILWHSSGKLAFRKVLVFEICLCWTDTYVCRPSPSKPMIVYDTPSILVCCTYTHILASIVFACCLLRCSLNEYHTRRVVFWFSYSYSGFWDHE